MKLSRNQLRKFISEQIDLSLAKDYTLDNSTEWSNLKNDIVTSLESQVGITPALKSATLAIAYHAYKAGSGKPGLYAKGKF